MNAFNQMLDKDLNNVFLNLEELADEHYINDEKTVCIVDIVEFTGKTASFTMHSRNAQYTSETLIAGDRMLYIREDFFRVFPKKDQRIDIDENPYIILDVRKNRGLLEIHLRDISS